MLAIIPLMVLGFTLATVAVCLYGPDYHLKAKSSACQSTLKLIESYDSRVRAKKLLSDPYFTWSDTISHTSPNREDKKKE